MSAKFARPFLTDKCVSVVEVSSFKLKYVEIEVQIPEKMREVARKRKRVLGSRVERNG